MGNVCFPLIGGALASLLGDLRMPYWFCGGCALVAIIEQEVLFRTFIKVAKFWALIGVGTPTFSGKESSESNSV